MFVYFISNNSNNFFFCLMFLICYVKVRADAFRSRCMAHALVCVCLCPPVGAGCSVLWSSRTAGSLLLLLPPLRLLGDFLGYLHGSEGWLLHGSLLISGERTASHVQKAEGWLMAKWPSRWTSTAPTPHRPSHTTTSTRAASNLHTSTCKCQTHAHTPLP